jgi:hypothetical protein
VNRPSKKTSSSIHGSRFTAHGFLRFTAHGFFLLPPLQISAGDLSEWARPALFALAALASVWVFHDARRREDFGAAAVWAWALLTLVFPPVALPLYLAARLYTRRAAAAQDSPTGGVAAVEGTSGAAGKEDEEETLEGVEESTSAGRPRARRRFAPTLLYTAALVFAGAAYFYADYQSFDARLARAERAKLYQRPEEAMGEYRAALRVREDARTHKLLGLELLQAGRAAEALDEFGAAERGREPDETLDFHAAAALEALARRPEAAARYRKFLEGRLCAKPRPTTLCETAAARLSNLETTAGP